MAKKDISSLKVGMNRTKTPHLMSEGEFSFQLNGASYSESGADRYSLTDEHSNILALKFADGFKFVGGRNHVVRDTTYIFLTNPTTGVSEIGTIANNRDFEEPEDQLTDCKDCNPRVTPLENRVQQPHQQYNTLLTDACQVETKEGPCLGFSVDHPIIDIVIKEQNIGTKIFWTSTPGNKEFRYIEVDNIDDYKLTGSDNCGETPVTTCLDCDKLKVFRDYTELKVQDYNRSLGGNLKKGSYEILGAYSDVLGNEFTSYTTLTPIIPLFDEANIIHEQVDNNAQTNYAITLRMSNVDERFDYYKIAVRYYTSKGVFTSYSAGVYNTTDKNIQISNNTGEAINNTKLSLVKPYLESVDGVTTTNNMMVLSGIKEREPVNLQPVMNLAGSVLKWMSFRAKEDLYSKADSYKYIGYNRDENQMFSIDFGFKQGYRTNSFVLIPNPPTSDEISDFNSGNDYQSITETVDNCDLIGRNKKWQFYNTATELGFCPQNETVETVDQVENITTYTNVIVPFVPPGQLTIDLSTEERFIDLNSFIIENLNNPTVLGSIAPYVDLNNLTGFNNEPNLPVATCTPYQMTEESLQVDNVGKEKVTFVYPPNADNYSTIQPPNNPFLYEVNGENSKIDNDHSYAYQSIGATSGKILPFARKRIQSNYNINCFQPDTLQRVIDGNIQTTYGNYYHQNKGALTVAELQDTNVNMPLTQGTFNSQDGQFTDKLHKTALWFKTNVSGREKFYLNISQNTNCKRETIKINGLNVRFGRNKTSLLRVSVFDKCNDTAPIHSEIIDLDDANFITIDSAIIGNLTTDEIYVSVETSIKQSSGLGPDWDNNDWVDDSDELNPVLQNGATSSDFVVTYIANLPCGAWNIVDRDEEPTSATVTWEKIDLSKSQKYTTTCTFEIPKLKDCEPVPYKYGEMGYYESTDKYPDNEELYDSSNLVIEKAKITNQDLLNQLSAYTETETATEIILSSEADFRCKNIRAYKMPDNKISPFIRDQRIGSNSETIISPLGITIDAEAIENLLDVAVDNNLIEEKLRDDIINYKIYRADASLSRSVVASGIVNNTKSYTVENEEINYFNYPFNSLGRDKYYPNNTDGEFDKIQVISPEFDYYKPTLPNEMSIQGYMFGNSNSRVLPVENHSKMVILGKKARTLATTLAILEVTSEVVISSSQALSNAQVQFGFTNNLGIPAFTAAGVIAAIGVVEGLVSKVGRYRLEWLRAFENLGTPYNFGYYTASNSNYNYLRTLQTDGDKLRGLSIRKYLGPGMLSISDTQTGNNIKLNNIDREESVFFTLGNFPIENLNSEYKEFDNSDTSPNFSSQVLSSEAGCEKGKSQEIKRNVASPYVAFKNYIPNQYGTVDSIKWIDTNYCIPISSRGICEGILGGDTFISRHSKKRKVRLFETDLLNSADLTPFSYEYNSNYGDPRFYVDYKVNDEVQTGSRIFPNIFYETQFDCGNQSNNFYVEPPAKFYLYAISFANFLCETRINTNFRNARKEPWNQFYPQNTDYEAITQPTKVPLTEPERFFINQAYQQTDSLNTKFILPEYYSKENEAKKAYNKNSGIYSLPDVNENSITEPWLVYRPNDKFTIESKYGNLVNVKGIESGQVLLYLENALQLQNAKNEFTDGQTDYTSELGNGGMFGKRAITLRDTDIGYGGSQSKYTLSCEFGHFHADVKRGQVFNYRGGQNLMEISKYKGNELNGMDVWFKEHLPFKIQRHFKNYNKIDNPYNGVGIHWGYDSKYKRVLLTKKDYVPTGKEKLNYDADTNLFNGEKLQQQIKNGNLKEVSWTITYKPETGSWESYMSYTPNYYINHTDYFQSGINSEGKNNGLWSHLLTNKSYRVFYGQKFPYIIEYPKKNEYISQRAESLNFSAQLKRYHNQYDYATIVDNPFSKMTIYNNYENSGELNLIKNNGTLGQLSKYPVTNKDNTQDVLVSYDNYRYNVDYFYNRVKLNTNNQPHWNWDENQINKTINPQAISFYGKNTLERMKGNYFMIRLTRDGDTNLDLDFGWSEQNATPIR